MLVTYFVNFRKLNDHLFGKELFIRFTASAFRKLPSIYVFSYFPFGFEGRMWDLIVSVPDHCLFIFSFYKSLYNECYMLYAFLEYITKTHGLTGCRYISVKLQVCLIMMGVCLTLIFEVRTKTEYYRRQSLFNYRKLNIS